MKVKIIAHIDMDAFFAAVEQRDDPTLHGKPVVIGADPKGGKGRGVVSTCSYEARRYGIHSAMPISEAYRRCPHAHFLGVNMRKYKDVSTQVFQILEDFTDLIEPISIDEAFFDITASYHFYKTPKETCRVIKRRIKDEIGLTASIGIASVKMVAKIASDLSKPDGLLEVKENQVLDFLWELPVTRLWGVGPKTNTALEKIGIRKIAELAQADEGLLYEILGEQGLHLHALANGIDPREIEMEDEVKSVSHEHTFDIDTADLEQIYAVMSVLSQKVSRRLRQRGLQGRTISIKLRTKDFKTALRSKTIEQRTNHFDEIYNWASKLFRSVYVPGSLIRLVGVKVANFEDAYVQDSLFTDPVKEKSEKVHQAVDRIKDKFGENAIYRGL